MPTNFPTSVDNFTNPTANDSLNLPSHSTQHANANDAIEAVEAYLLTGAGRTGLVFIKTQAITAGVTSVTISNAFSSSFDNYKIVLGNFTSNVAVSAQFRLNNVTSAYYYTNTSTPNYSTASGNVTFNNAANTSSYETGAIAASGGNNTSGCTIELQNPFLTTSTAIQSMASDTRSDGGGPRAGSGYHSTAASYTDFTLVVNGGPTFQSGNVAVYGYAKA